MSRKFRDFLHKNSNYKILTMAAIYAPLDSDNKFYFEEVDNLIQAIAGTSNFQMLIGNFNTTLNFKRDRLGYSNITDTHKNCRALINAWFQNEKWVDAFDYHHPYKKVTLGNRNKNMSQSKQTPLSLECCKSVQFEQHTAPHGTTS